MDFNKIGFLKNWTLKNQYKILEIFPMKFVNIFFYNSKTTLRFS